MLPSPSNEVFQTDAAHGVVLPAVADGATEPWPALVSAADAAQRG